MIKQLRFKTLLLLCALIVGSLGAWGETAGFSLKNVSSVPLAAGSTKTTTITGSISETWNVEITGTWSSSSMQSTAGEKFWQMGSKDYPITSASFSTTGIPGTISSIVVHCSSYSAKATVNCTVGGNNFGTQGQSTASWTTVGDVTFSGSASGAVVVTIDNSASGARAAYIQSITVTYAQSSKKPNGLAWSAASKDVTYNTPYDLPTLSNPNNLTVSYSSSNPTVATVDAETGAVTINNVNGYTTITATTEGNETYAAGAVSYTLNVSKAVVDGEFDFSLYNYGSGIESTNNSSTYVTSESTWTAGNVTMKLTGKYRWWLNNKGVTDLRLYNNSPLSAATFSVPDGYVITQIETYGGNFVTIEEGDGTISSNTWTGASQSVKLAISTLTVTFNSIVVTYTNNFKKSIGADEWATWVAPYNLTVPSGVTAYIATKSTSDNVVLTSVDKIKGGTAVILNGSNAEYTFAVTTESVDYPKTNLLLISDDNVSNGVFVLAKKNGTVGFYKWAGGTLGKGRVYLDAPAAGAREFIGFDFEDEMTTGINEVKIANNNEYFNLGGQRVAQPKKGLYIVNGKKVIIK